MTKKHPTQKVLNTIFNINDGKNNQGHTLNYKRGRSSPFIVYPVINKDTQTIDVWVATQYKINPSPTKKSILVASIVPNNKIVTVNPDGMADLKTRYLDRYKRKGLRLSPEQDWNVWRTYFEQQLDQIQDMLESVTLNHTRFSLNLTENFGSKTLLIEFDQNRPDDKRHIRRFIQDHIYHNDKLDCIRYTENRQASLIHTDPKYKASEKQYGYLFKLYREVGEEPNKLYSKKSVGAEIHRLEQKLKQQKGE